MDTAWSDAEPPTHLLWQADEAGDAALLASAVALADFAATDPRVHPLQRKRLLDEAVWFVSERGNVSQKFRIRYRSAEAVALQVAVPQRSAWGKHLRHDHVTTRKALLAALQLADANRAALLTGVIACVVTREEHARLGPHAELHGWDRYVAAGIDVRDMVDGSRLQR